MMDHKKGLESRKLCWPHVTPMMITTTANCPMDKSMNVFNVFLRKLIHSFCSHERIIHFVEVVSSLRFEICLEYVVL